VHHAAFGVRRRPQQQEKVREIVAPPGRQHGDRKEHGRRGEGMRPVLSSCELGQEAAAESAVVVVHGVEQNQATALGHPVKAQRT